MSGLLLPVYRQLLRALPRDFRQEYAEEIAGVFGDLLRDRSPAARLALFGRAVTDLGATAVTEHRAALSRRPAVAAAATVAAPAAPRTRRHRPAPTRRGFLRGAFATAVAGMGSGGAAAVIAYLWPQRGSGFGTISDIGSVEEIHVAVASAGGALAVPASRAYVVTYDGADDPTGRYADIADGGLLALYQKCVHLGCRVPWCDPSTRFECPCHGSRYNRWGEWQRGPAPRGLDRFVVRVEDNRVLVDSRRVITGPAQSVDTLEEGPTGPPCA